MLVEANYYINDIMEVNTKENDRCFGGTIVKAEQEGSRLEN